MATIYNVYDQVAELIAQLEPEKVLALRASSEVQNRFEYLVEKTRNEKTNRQEKDELNHFIVLERLFRLAKIRAHQTQKNNTK